MRKVLVVVSIVAGCSRTPPSSAPVRLVDRFTEAKVEGSPAKSGREYARTEWRFTDRPVASDSWQPAQGITELRIDEGLLRGHASSNQPVLVAERRNPMPETELLHGVEVRARVSAGTRMEVRFSGEPELSLPRVLGAPIGALTTPLRAGEETETYFLRATSAVSPKDIAHVLLLPTNEENADFAIESIRLVFRGEHLRSIASGVGWHGMSEIYRESIVTRSPEVVHYEVDLPAKPSLELALATIEPTPVTFRVTVGDRVLERQVSEPDIWKSAALDLAGLGGHRVELTLTLEAEKPGTLGFWGTPVVRSNVAPEGAPQAVVLIITDTLRPDHLDLYGYERKTAPTLTRIASEGVVFSDTISQATWTKVSVPSIQTSLYPTSHTVADIPDRLPASATTIAEVYRDAGYATLALTSIPFVGQLTNLHQGYEELHEAGSLPTETVKTAGMLVGRLLPWIETHRGVPFFAMLHVADAHSPFRPDEKYETAFAEPGEMDRLDELTEKVRPHIRDPLMKLMGMPREEELGASGIDPDEFVRHEVNGLDGSIRGMDEALGHVFEKLDELGLAERALVAVVADHGTELLEHGGHFHGHTVYGELNRVPMFLWGPGFVPRGRRVGAMVQTIDLMPTMLALSGLEAPAHVQGQSLTSLFEQGGEAHWSRPAITESLLNLRHLPEETALISEGWKLVRIEPADAEPRFELYAHDMDPLDQKDVAAEHPELVERLSHMMDDWRKFAEATRLDDDDATGTLDAEELERLRSLGYVQ